MKKIFLILLSIILLNGLLVTYAFAADNTTAPSFYLKSSSIIDGDTNVPTNSIIELNFSDNFIDITVAKRNSKCFSLTDSKGNAVKIHIIYADLQIQPLYKTYCFISPVETLKCDEVYTLTISEQLVTKKEYNIDKGYTISFTTSSTPTTEPPRNEKLQTLGEDVLTYAIEQTIVNSTTSETTVPQSTTDTPKNSNFTTYVGLGLIITTIVVTILNVRTQKHSDSANQT